MNQKDDELGMNATNAHVPYAVPQAIPLPSLASTRVQQGCHENNVNGPNYSSIVVAFPSSFSANHFEFIQKCRWTAVFMFLYYLFTFLFVQPFFLGTLGIMTGFLGYFGCREPIDMIRFKWLKSYIIMNYLMALCTMCVVIMFVIYSPHRRDTTAIILMVLVMSTNLLIHFRAERIARQFHAELMRTIQPVARQAVVLTHPTAQTMTV
jgi:hypothetical protein